MRQTYRADLPFATRQFLFKCRREASRITDVRPLWKQKRGSSEFVPVLEALKTMAGSRQRCLYCDDSLGCDVEHYRPAAAFPAHSFVWSNLLWICTNCNRRKGTKFPLDAVGNPLLLDPCVDDPWNHFIFDAATGEVAPRWIDSSHEDPRASCTLRIVSSLSIEAITTGRQIASSRMNAAARRWVDDPENTDARRRLLEEASYDDFALARWYVLREGSLEEPWATVRATYAGMWRRLVKACSS